VLSRRRGSPAAASEQWGQIGQKLLELSARLTAVTCSTGGGPNPDFLGEVAKRPLLMVKQTKFEPAAHACS